MSELGEEIFEIFYKGYSEKQWMRPCEQIPASIGKRLPIRYDYNDAYHDTKYCGIPKDGNYTQIFEKLLDGIEVQLETDFKDLDWKKLAKKLVYCGPIDELFNSKYQMWKNISKENKTTIFANVVNLFTIHGVKLEKVGGKLEEIRKQMEQNNNKITVSDLNLTVGVVPGDITKKFQINSDYYLAPIFLAGNIIFLGMFIFGKSNSDSDSNSKLLQLLVDKYKIITASL